MSCSAVKTGLVAGAAVGAVALKVCGCDPKKALGAAVAGFVVATGVCTMCGCCQKKKTTNELVTESWAVVKSAFTFEQVGDLFYKNLFELAPGIKGTVFGNTDHTMQPGVSLLDQPEKLVPALVKCGERHAAYGQNGNWVEKASSSPPVSKPLSSATPITPCSPKSSSASSILVSACWTSPRSSCPFSNELVTESWAVVGDLFYKNLFTLAPQVRRAPRRLRRERQLG
eukprot:272120_1